jgi:hypothetical protein
MGFASITTQLPVKFPFWSAILTQSANSVTVSAGATYTVAIQPPSGESWLVWVNAFENQTASGSYAAYYAYNGTSATLQYASYTYNGAYGLSTPYIAMLELLTSSLYGQIALYNANTDSSCPGGYGYSGFQLSQPLFTPKRLDDPHKPFIVPTSATLPDPIQPLAKYEALILGLDPTKPNDYVLGVILERDTPLAVDPATGQVLERASQFVSANTLANLITQFQSGQLDYVKAGYEKYLLKWKAERIDFGIV